MTWENKPVWTEGMFLRPQHFQQLERYCSAQLEARVEGLRPFGWGLTELQIDDGLLKTGKLALNRCSGVFDDGTPFRVPAEAAAPVPMEVMRDLRESVVHLCLPVRRAGTADVALEPGLQIETRFIAEEFEAADTVYGEATRTPLNIGRLQLLLRAEGEPLEGYSTIPIARVIERRPDDSVILDGEFIPTVHSHLASPTLIGFLHELEGILHQRGEAIAGRLGTLSSKAVADITDFLTLIIVNRAESAIKHLAALPGVHPADLYLYLLELAGELATITGSGNRPSFMPLYDHRAISACFGPLMRELRRSLSFASAQKAVPIPLEDRSYGIRVGVIHDGTLFTDAAFVLAARAAVDLETVRANLPRRIKIGAVENIRDLVMRQLSGVEIYPMPAEPRQIPFRANTVYFSINTRSEHWQHVRASRSVAVHVAGDIPDLQLELWAIRGMSS
jgi:type VI secretion system protein ImpJ